MALSIEQVFEMIRKENEYAKGWAKGDDEERYNICEETGAPFSTGHLMAFAQQYLDDAKVADQNYCPDRAAVRIRVNKAITLLVRALMLHGEPADLQRIAGTSKDDFPILYGGLKTFDELTDERGEYAPDRAERETLRRIMRLRGS